MIKSTPFCGSFIFIRQGYGILSSTYQNTTSTEPYPETAKWFAKNEDSEVDETNDSFAGQYYTTWLEAPMNNHVKAVLTIKRKHNATYSLHWSKLDPSSNTTYDGIGMLHDNKLIGCYW